MNLKDSPTRARVMANDARAYKHVFVAGNATIFPLISMLDQWTPEHQVVSNLSVNNRRAALRRAQELDLSSRTHNA